MVAQYLHHHQDTPKPPIRYKQSHRHCNYNRWLRPHSCPCKQCQRTTPIRMPSGFRTHHNEQNHKLHNTGQTRLCQRLGSTTQSPTKSMWICSGLRQVCRLYLVIDSFTQSRHVRILSVGLVGSQTKSTGLFSVI